MTGLFDELIERCVHIVEQHNEKIRSGHEHQATQRSQL